MKEMIDLLVPQSLSLFLRRASLAASARGGRGRAAEFTALTLGNADEKRASDAVLERMRRPGAQKNESPMRRSRAFVKAQCPISRFARHASSRFTGETRTTISSSLLDFLEEMQFERVGAFAYSPQEGTRAAEMNDDVPDGVKATGSSGSPDLCSAGDYGKAVQTSVSAGASPAAR